jgi:hypothetical protein
LKEKSVLNQTSFFLSQVGNASVCLILGDAVRQIQEKAIRRGVAPVDFTCDTPIGCRARSVFEKKLRAQVRAEARPNATRRKVTERSGER